MRILQKLLVTATSALILSVPLRSQTIIPTVEIDARRLSLQQQSELEGLNNGIIGYIRESNYTGESYDFDIEFNIQIYLQSSIEGGSEKIYVAQVSINNGIDQRFFDKSWEFVYNANDALYPSGVFHSITGFIDYYVYLLLAGEFDLIEPLAGNRFYDLARELASRGKTSTHPRGWSKRVERVDDFTDNRRFRIMKGVYSDFMFLLYEEHKPEDAHAKLTELLDLFEEIFGFNSRDRYTLEFLDAHKDELSEAAFGYRKPEIFERLIRINPDYRETYRTYLNKLKK